MRLLSLSVATGVDVSYQLFFSSAAPCPLSDAYAKIIRILASEECTLPFVSDKGSGTVPMSLFVALAVFDRVGNTYFSL